MTRIKLATVVLVVLAFVANSTQAKYPAAGPGLPGTVTSVSSRFFMMDLDAGGYFKVFISPNTNFQLHGHPSDSSHVKVGVRVRITGTTDNGSVVDAYKVNVISE